MDGEQPPPRLLTGELDVEEDPVGGEDGRLAPGPRGGRAYPGCGGAVVLARVAVLRAVEAEHVGARARALQAHVAAVVARALLDHAVAVHGGQGHRAVGAAQPRQEPAHLENHVVWRRRGRKDRGEEGKKKERGIVADEK